MARPTINTTFNARDRMSPAMRRMSRNANRFSGRARRSFSNVGRSIARMRTLLVGAGAALVGGRLVRGLRDFAQAGDNLAKTARDIGMNVEALQELRFAGEQMGVSNSVLESSFDSLNRRLGRARDGFGSLHTSLNNSNPELLEQVTNAENSAEAFELIIEEMRGLENQSERAALAQAAFSSSGSDMIRFANASADEIENLMRQQREAGNITQEQAEQSEEFNDTLNRLGRSMQGVRNRALGPLIAQLTPLIERTREWINENQELIQQRIGQTIQAIRDTVQTTVAAVRTFSPAIMALIGTMAAWKAVTIAMTAKLLIMRGVLAVQKFIQMVRIIRTIIRVKRGWAAVQAIVNVVMTANPIGVIIVAIGALIGVIAMLVAHWDTVVATLRRVWDWFTNLMENPLIAIPMTVLAPFLALPAIIANNWESISGFFTDLWDGVVAVFESAWERIQPVIDLVMGAVDRMRNAIRTVGNALGFGGENEPTGTATGGTMGVGSVITRNQGVQESRSESVNRSEVDVNFANMPAGTSVLQRGEAPNVRLNLGMAGGL